MGDQINFERILEQEFRWPRPGDDPLANYGGITASIAEDDFSRFVLMMEGYKRAAEALVDRCLKDWREANCLVFPIMFLYRHCLELQLKYIVNTYGVHVGCPPDWNTHDLTRLWGQFKKVLNEFGIDDPEQTDSVVESIVAQFAKVDRDSSSHRYPCDTKGNPLPVIQDRVDLQTLKDVMDGAFGYFSGCDGYMDALASA